ncbi:MAG: hypothetical protein KC468_38805 [Myxococcales bacterium]|nr:hypothetical protein [Myxococcales bacterium]
MTLPSRNATHVTVDGVHYRVVLRESIELPADSESPAGLTWVFHALIAQREDGQGPRLHGMLRGPWAPGYRWLVGESEAWLRRLHARVDLDLTRRDVYDRPHGVTLWPRDWPQPGDDR